LFTRSQAECDKEGRFRLELDRPGKWVCWRRTDEASFVLELEIPNADEHELALDLDTMRRVESLDELPF
jgi:hypothetical protein